VRDAPGDARLSELAAELGLSVRTLERRFRENLGLSPKKYQRITRIAKVLDLLHSREGDWAGIAGLAGYYDQSHLIDDCHSILGRSPERFLRTVTNAGSLEIGLVFDRPSTE
jgi:transcriptional regulator GlxA family with amidase domain